MRNKKPAKENLGLERDPRVVEYWRLNFQGICDVRNVNALEFLPTLNLGSTDLVYCDPPYLPEVRRRRRVYKFDLSIDDHVTLLDYLASLPCMVMISGYQSDLYNSRLQSWRKITFDAKTHVGIRQECVWLNFPEPAELHDARYLGNSFRDRQSLRRRRERIISRFARMEPKERQDILQSLNSSFAPGHTATSEKFNA